MVAGKVVASARQHARMLCRGNPDLSLVAERLREVMQHHVVRFRRTRGPDDLERTAIQKCSQLFSRGIQGNLGALANAVRTSKDSQETARCIQPCLPGDGRQRSRGVVIEIHWEEPGVSRNVGDGCGEHTLLYKRARFVTRLPVDRLYSPSHFWIAEHEAGVWRVGFTRFATRMLGEIVEHEFQVEMGARSHPGRSSAGSKDSKLSRTSIASRRESLPAGTRRLLEKIELLGKEPYDAGWLYAIEGKPDSRCTDVHGYVGLLDATIDKMLEKRIFRRRMSTQARAGYIMIGGFLGAGRRLRSGTRAASDLADSVSD